MHHRTLVGMMVCAACLWGSVRPVGAVVQYTITDLGALGSASMPEHVNDLGQVVGYGYTGTDMRGFYWDAGTKTWIDTFGGTSSYAAGINNRSQVVGWAYTGSTSSSAQAFLWQNGVLQNLNTPGGPTLTKAWDINDAGQVAVVGTTGGYIWQNGMLTSLPLENPRAINSLGQVGGGKYTGQLDATGYPVQRPVLWDGTSLTDLGTFGGPAGFVYDINDQGEAVGYADTTKTAGGGVYIPRAFIYRNGQLQQPLGSDGDPSYALGINNLGQVVGRYNGSAFSGTAHAFLYDAGTFTDLNDAIPANSGWVLKTAQDINDHGQIVGIGGNGTSSSRLYLLTPVPEPASLLLLLIAGFVRKRPRRVRQ